MDPSHPSPPQQTTSSGRLRVPRFFDRHRQEFAQQVQWLLAGRVAVILLCLMILLLYEEGAPRQFAGAYASLVVGLGVAAVQLVLYRQVRDLERLVLVGICLDVLLESVLSYMTGGIYNVGFAFLYFASILSAVLLLSDLAAFLAASLATVALAVIAALYWLAHHYSFNLPLVPPELYQEVDLRWGRITANLIGVGLAFHGVAFLGMHLPSRMSRVQILTDEIVDRMREGLVAIDRRGHVVMVNREACRLLNWGHGTSIVGRRFEDSLRRREDQQVLEILARGEDVHSEIELVIRDREPLMVEVITTVLRDPRQRIRGVVGLFRDLSLKQRLEDMETRLAHLSGTEETALNIAHEIRTPLASIRGAVQELTRHALDDPSDKRLAEIVRSESDRVDRILQEFLDFARMRPATRRSVDLAMLVDETCVLLDQRPDAKRARLEWPHEAPVYPVYGDADQLRQALLNLGTNALEAVGEQGTVRFSLRELDLPERSVGPERRLGSRLGVEVAVEDDGAAPVDEATAKKVFLPFFTTKKGGLGLGLAITQKIARLHEGDITCGPSELGGTAFRLVIPLEDTPAEPPASVLSERAT